MKTFCLGGRIVVRIMLFAFYILLHEQALDMWVWRLDHNEAFFFIGAYHLLTHNVLDESLSF